MIHYPDTALHKFTEATYDDDEALQWLLQNGYPELAAAKEAIICSEMDAVYWLVRHNKPALLAFVRAAQGNFSAIKELLRLKEPVLAATANAARGDHEALEWLHKMGFPAWAKLSEAIAFNLPRRRNRYFTYSDRDTSPGSDSRTFGGGSSGGWW